MSLVDQYKERQIPWNRIEDSWSNFSLEEKKGLIRYKLARTSRYPTCEKAFKTQSSVDQEAKQLCEQYELPKQVIKVEAETELLSIDRGRWWIWLLVAFLLASLISSIVGLCIGTTPIGPYNVASFYIVVWAAIFSLGTAIYKETGRKRKLTTELHTGVQQWD